MPDLQTRVSQAIVTVPPLRSRREDIPGLVRCVVADLCAAAQIDPKHPSNQAIALLTALPWRGNVVELEALAPHSRWQGFRASDSSGRRARARPAGWAVCRPGRTTARSRKRASTSSGTMSRQHSSSIGGGWRRLPGRWASSERIFIESSASFRRPAGHRGDSCRSGDTQSSVELSNLLRATPIPPLNSNFIATGSAVARRAGAMKRTLAVAVMFALGLTQISTLSAGAGSAGVITGNDARPGRAGRGCQGQCPEYGGIDCR